MNYGQRWRQHRRTVHQVMTPDIVPQYQVFHLDAARNLLRLILRDPQELGSHIKLCAVSPRYPSYWFGSAHHARS